MDIGNQKIETDENFWGAGQNLLLFPKSDITTLSTRSTGHERL